MNCPFGRLDGRLAANRASDNAGGSRSSGPTAASPVRMPSRKLASERASAGGPRKRNEKLSAGGFGALAAAGDQVSPTRKTLTGPPRAYRLRTTRARSAPTKPYPPRNPAQCSRGSPRLAGREGASHARKASVEKAPKCQRSLFQVKRRSRPAPDARQGSASTHRILAVFQVALHVAVVFLDRHRPF